MKKINPINNAKQTTAGQDEALDIIKQRIREIYGEDESPKSEPKKLMDRFWEHSKKYSDQESAWRDFYEGLGDDEKLQLWDEYHSIQSSSESAPIKNTGNNRVKTTLGTVGVVKSGIIVDEDSPKPKKARSKIMQKRAERKELLDHLKKSRNTDIKTKKSKLHWLPLIISLSIGFLILFAQYNPLIIALAKQYVSPGDSLRSPVIIDPNANINVGKQSKIIIPKINVDVPVVYDINTRGEQAIQNGLERGVVHYHQTSVPGEAGNNVIVGHSSNNFLNSGKYKFAFVLLDRLNVNDTFMLHYEGTRYVYKVTNKQTVEPTDFSLTLPTEKPTVTLITCTPPGTSWKRLIIQGEQISPAPSTNQLKAPNNVNTEPQGGVVPGNAPSLWSRISNSLF